MKTVEKVLNMLKCDEEVKGFYGALNQQMFKKSKLGNIFQENINEIRDQVLSTIQRIIDGTWDDKKSQILFAKTKSWDPINQKILEDYIRETIDTTILQIFQSLDDETDLDVVYKQSKKNTISLKEACNETYGSVVDAVADLFEENQ